MATEKRLIDANALGNGIGVYVATNAYLNDTALDALEKVAKWIDEAPTVDAVEVTCKDCKQCYETTDGGNCRWWNRRIQEDDFCSYGERKDND